MWLPPLLHIFIFIFIFTTLIFVDSRAINFKRSNEGQYFSPNDANIAKIITVSQSGQVDFNKIQDAIDSVPTNNQEWICVRISSGIYTEKVKITREKSYIFLEGDGAENTTIRWNDQDIDRATFTSFAGNFVAKGITFQNYYNKVNDVNQNIAPAAAAAIYGDKSTFYGCNFVGLQDTLWDVSGRHYFRDCRIEGAVDFIFGDGQSFYENCELRVNNQFLPSDSVGYITAQGRDSENDPGGFVFYGGHVSGNGQIFLGRAWGSYSRVIFQKLEFDINVMPQGWDAWEKPIGEMTYIEEDCSGKGYDVSKRVAWSQHDPPENEMQQYTRANFIQDEWLTTQPK